MKNILLFVTVLLMVGADDSLKDLDLGLVFDVGLNHTTLHMFQWPRRQNNRTVVNIWPYKEPVSTLRNTTRDAFAKGLHWAAIDTITWDGKTQRIVDTPDLESYVFTHFNTLRVYAEKNIPEDRWSSVQMWIKGTDGMQSLATADQNSIWAAVRKYFRRESRFTFKDAWVGTLGWEERGIFNFIAVNLLEGAIQRNNVSTWGAVSLAHDHLYVSFEAKNFPKYNFSIDFKFPNIIDDVISVYSAVYPNYGFVPQWNHYNELLISQRPNNVNQQSPCLFYGANHNFTSKNGNTYNMVGLGDWSMCYEFVGALVNKSVMCAPSNQPCLFNNVSSPALPSSVAFDEVFDAVNQLIGANILTNDTWEYVRNTSARVCKFQWDFISTTNTLDALSMMEKLSLCWRPVYLLRLFNDGFEVPVKYQDQLSANRVSRVKQFAGLNNTRISWVVGALNYEISRLPVSPSSANNLSFSLTTFVLATLAYLFV